MPRVSIAQEFRNSDTARFPKYKLTLGEKSRIWMPEDPWMEWYHRIEAPMIEHGEPVMEAKETRRGPIETWKMDWIGNVFCLGDTGTPEKPGPLITAGIDPENCPACESAAKKTGVAAPQQRFAANIVKYKVKGRGQSPYELASPTSAEVLIWGYTSRIHGSLHEIQSEHGNVRQHDLKVELEDTPGADMFQKIKTLAVIVKPAYTDPKVREYVIDLWKKHPENRATDDQLRDACLGRDVPRLVLMDMVRRAETQYRQVEQAGTGGGDTAAADSAFNGDLSSGVDALLDSVPGAADNTGDTRWEDSRDTVNGETAMGGGGLDEFMSEEEKQAQFAAIEDAKRGAADPFGDEFMSDDQRPSPHAKEHVEADQLAALAQTASADPFADETSPASGATTTRTSAPAAEKVSPTEPKSAVSAASSFEEEDLNEPISEAPKPNGAKPGRPTSSRVTTPKTRAAAEQPSLTPEPAKAAAGEVFDFDQLFAD